MNRNEEENEDSSLISSYYPYDTSPSIPYSSDSNFSFFSSNININSSSSYPFVDSSSFQSNLYSSDNLSISPSYFPSESFSSYLFVEDTNKNNICESSIFSSHSDFSSFDYSKILSQNNPCFHFSSCFSESSSNIFCCDEKSNSVKKNSSYDRNRNSECGLFLSDGDVIREEKKLKEKDENYIDEEDKEKSNDSSPIFGINCTDRKESSNSFCDKQRLINCSKTTNNFNSPFYFPPHPINSQKKYLHKKNSNNFNICVSIPSNFSFPSFSNPPLFNKYNNENDNNNNNNNNNVNDNNNNKENDDVNDNNNNNVNDNNNNNVNDNVNNSFFSSCNSNNSVSKSNNDITYTNKKSSTSYNSIKNFKNKRNRNMSVVFIYLLFVFKKKFFFICT
jgi:hypothetical protein